MKKEYLVFFVLLVAVAMIMGSTFAIVSALQTYKSQQTKTPVNSQAMVEKANSETERTAAVSRESRYISSNAPGRDGASSSKLTPFETREVKRMLNELGYTKETLSQSLKSFQEEHQLANTGILDSVTLDSIINLLSLNKARSFY